MRVHIIEDDPALARNLQINFDLEGYTVFLSENLKSALNLQKIEQIDFVILDLGLPDGSGFDFLKNEKNRHPAMPIIILSAQSDEDSVVKGLQLGANDFIKKPYSFKELHARMKVVLKKPIIDEKQYSFANITVFLDRRVIKSQQSSLDLNRSEFDIFAHLIRHAESIVTRDSLLLALNKESEIFDRTIDSHISHIRKSLKKFEIHSIKISSVYGLGYRLEKA